MPKVVEVHVCRNLRRGPRLDPVIPEVAPPQPTALGAEEDVTVTVGPREAVEVAFHIGQEFGREGYRPDTRI